MTAAIASRAERPLNQWIHQEIEAPTPGPALHNIERLIVDIDLSMSIGTADLPTRSA
jgi:hypothetical protein